MAGMKLHKRKLGAAGVYYGPVLLHVVERDEFGRPSKVEVGYDDSEFQTYDGQRFVTAFIHSSAVAEYERRKAKG